MAKLIKIHGLEVARIDADQRYLHRDAFLSLRQGERVAAYLALTWPQARSADVIQKVCHLKGSCHSITRELRRAGAIQIVAVGMYQLVPEQV